MREVRLGVVARMDKSGLGQGQTLPLTKMLNPYRVLLIDSTMFNQRVQHPEWYRDFVTHTVNGFPTNAECIRFLNGLTHVIFCETPMNWNLVALANQRGIKTVFCPNPEFVDHFLNPLLPMPWKVVAPSNWMIEKLRTIFPAAIVIPPPLFPEDFEAARETNLARRGFRRFLHVAGMPAVNDRAGTQTALEALKYTSAEFDLVIRSQKPLVCQTDDPRVTFDSSDPDNNAELFADADCLVHPRRYGGLNLIANEALTAGLPVIMPGISPNDAVLPSEWLVPAQKAGQFQTRTTIDLYDTDPIALAAKIDEFCVMSDEDLRARKERAFQIGHDNYSVQAVKPRWEELLG